MGLLLLTAEDGHGYGPRRIHRHRGPRQIRKDHTSRAPRRPSCRKRGICRATQVPGYGALSGLVSLSQKSHLLDFCYIFLSHSSSSDRTTGTGQMIDAYLRGTSELDDRAIHLLFSANRWEAASALEAHLAAGTTVLCDRYAFSGVVFSAAKGLPLAWCRAPDVALPAPDLTLFLDLTPEQAATRGGYGAERYEKEEMQARVRTLFKSMGSETRGWMTIDAGLDRDAVAQDIWKQVEPLGRGVDGPIKKLWVDDTLSSVSV
ncbi:thymidylate kinase-domain-containing protein [Multifurca ochricompacta]|uniref:dTMP kinase n=1 Tax=Multifurca ochricompacta TaxID=376703 RepID=A0AAD4QRF2_9AGAM|nr:thymidylate kinase-domain-containing protein [Multifurca ochricompacta]